MLISIFILVNRNITNHIKLTQNSIIKTKDGGWRIERKNRSKTKTYHHSGGNSRTVGNAYSGMRKTVL